MASNNTNNQPQGDWNNTYQPHEDWSNTNEEDRWSNTAECNINHSPNQRQEGWDNITGQQPEGWNYTNNHLPMPPRDVYMTPMGPPVQSRSAYFIPFPYDYQLQSLQQGYPYMTQGDYAAWSVAKRNFMADRYNKELQNVTDGPSKAHHANISGVKTDQSVLGHSYPYMPQPDFEGWSEAQRNFMASKYNELKNVSGGPKKDLHADKIDCGVKSNQQVPAQANQKATVKHKKKITVQDSKQGARKPTQPGLFPVQDRHAIQKITVQLNEEVFAKTNDQVTAQNNKQVIVDDDKKGAVKEDIESAIKENIESAIKEDIKSAVKDKKGSAQDDKEGAAQDNEKFPAKADQQVPEQASQLRQIAVQLVKRVIGEDNEQSFVQANEQVSMQNNKQGAIQDSQQLKEQVTVQSNKQDVVQDNDQVSVQNDKQGTIQVNQQVPEQASQELKEQVTVKSTKQSVVQDNKQSAVKVEEQANQQGIMQANEQVTVQHNKQVQDDKQNAVQANDKVTIKDNKQSTLQENKQNVVQSNDQVIIQDTEQGVQRITEHVTVQIEPVAPQDHEQATSSIQKVKVAEDKSINGTAHISISSAQANDATCPKTTELGGIAASDTRAKGFTGVWYAIIQETKEDIRRIKEKKSASNLVPKERNSACYSASGHFKIVVKNQQALKEAQKQNQSHNESSEKNSDENGANECSGINKASTSKQGNSVPGNKATNKTTNKTPPILLTTTEIVVSKDKNLAIDILEENSPETITAGASKPDLQENQDSTNKDKKNVSIKIWEEDVNSRRDHHRNQELRKRQKKIHVSLWEVIMFYFSKGCVLMAFVCAFNLVFTMCVLPSEFSHISILVAIILVVLSGFGYYACHFTTVPSLLFCYPIHLTFFLLLSIKRQCRDPLQGQCYYKIPLFVFTINSVSLFLGCMILSLSFLWQWKHLSKPGRKAFGMIIQENIRSLKLLIPSCKK